MPAWLKLILSILVTLVALAVHRSLAGAARGFDGWLVLGLGAFMILAVWLFPEPRRQGSKDRRS